MNETILEWTQRMLLMQAWEEHESAAWTCTLGGARGDGPSLSYSMHVKTAPLPPWATEQPWWRWRVKAGYGSAKYIVTGHASSKTLGKVACVRAMRQLVAAFTSDVL